jgi:hypothetical protein
MKKLYSFIIALFTVATLMGQAPESFKYQAVLRNARGDIKVSKAVIIGIDILKSSASGLSVYSETHNVTTDMYGLINLEIGKGTPTLGTFSDVDWSTDSYYIKLIVDGIEMGTGQLLSVPYALYSKTSGFEINNFDFSGAATGDILQFNGTKWVTFTPNFALTSHTHIDASTTVSGFMSGTDKTKLDGLQNAAVHYIGESYEGGIVFYVFDNGQHGLIAAPEDISIFNGEGYTTNFTWEYGYATSTGATGDGLGAGTINTTLALATQMSNDVSQGWFAARACVAYSVTVDTVIYGGWYIPSRYELNLLYSQRATVGGFADDYYWSSTEYYNNDLYSDYNYAWYQDFYEVDGGYQDYTAKSDYYRVRAIRAF